MDAPVGSAIVVGVRVRPFDMREQKFNSKCIVSMEGNVTKLTVVSAGKVMSSQLPKEFVFDFAFWTHSKDVASHVVSCEKNKSGSAPIYSDQLAVYEALGKQILHNVLQGYNSCLFAYGQTGSGKTYSMMGTQSDPGVLPRLGKELFQKIDEMKAADPGSFCTVEASFCEIYNEKVRDLMSSDTAAGSKNLPIRQHPQLGVFVEGLKKFTISNAADFSGMLETGMAARATASTNMNNASSRSHAIVMMTITQKPSSSLGSQKTGRLCLVDLAGSERVESTGAVGQTASEGQSINLSLTTLGMCLNRLAEKAEGKQGLHVPYRDSALTFLISDNLGGNSKTAMLANISPSSLNFDETLSTLRFSSVAKKIRNVAVINESAMDKTVRDLREELKALTAKLRQMKETGPATADGLMLEAQIQQESAAIENNVAYKLPQAIQNRTTSQPRHIDPHAWPPGSNPSAHFPSGLSHNSMSPGRELCVDWNTPQLISLDPDNTQIPITMPLFEGANRIEIRGVDMIFEYDGLQNRVTVFGSSGGVCLNGTFIEDEGAILRHRDRLVVGNCAMWFAHRAAFASCDFNTTAGDVIHLVLLEKYFRWVVFEERAKDAMSIGKAFFNIGVASNNDGAGGASFDARDTIMISHALLAPGAARITPRSTNHLLATIGDDVAMSNESVYKLEVQLVEEYPVPNKIPKVLSADDNDGNAEQEEQLLTYDEAIKERERANAEQTLLMTQLKERIMLTNSLALAASGVSNGSLNESLFRERRRNSRASSRATVEVNSPDQARLLAHKARCLQREFSLPNEFEEENDEDFTCPYDSEEEDVQQQISDMTQKQDMQAEYAYHRKLRGMQAFARNGPQDATDAEMWKKMHITPPFYGDPSLQIRLRGTFLLLDIGTVNTASSGSGGPSIALSATTGGNSAWISRHVAVSSKFIFVFKRSDAKERSVFAIYVVGSVTTRTLESSYHVLHIVPACPRSSKDASLSGHLSSIKIAFKSAVDASNWQQTLHTISTPPMPLSLYKRFVSEQLDEGATRGNPSLLMSPTAARGGRGVTAQVANFRPLDDIKKCEKCNKGFWLFTKKHQCSDCCGVFCSGCIDVVEKRCRPCIAERSIVKVIPSADDAALLSRSSERRNVRVTSAQLPHSIRLIQDFIVRFGDSSTQILFRVDHFTGRAHTCSADAISSAERHKDDNDTLLLQFKDGGCKRILFSNAFDREQCLESLNILRGCRLFLNSVKEVVDVSDVLVTDESSSALIRATRQSKCLPSVWTGIEQLDRSIPFHDTKIQIFVVLGMQENWSDKIIHSLGLFIVSKVPMGPALPTLFLVAHESWRVNIVSHCVTPVSSIPNSKSLCCGISVTILEATLLLIGVQAAPTVTVEELVDFSNADLFSVAGFEANKNDRLDASQQYDNIFAIGAPPLTDFERASNTVQYRCNSATMSRGGVTSAEFVVPMTNFHCSKFCNYPPGRPLVLLRKVVFHPTENTTSYQGVPPTHEDLTSTSELWANLAFDRFDETSGKIEKIPQSLPQPSAESPEGSLSPVEPPRAACADSSPQPIDPTRRSPFPREPLPGLQSPSGGNLLHSLLLASALPEYYDSRHLFVRVGSVGTAVLAIKNCGNGDVNITSDVFRKGTRVGVAEVVLQNLCVVKWR